jgi:hypothetical protein
MDRRRALEILTIAVAYLWIVSWPSVAAAQETAADSIVGMWHAVYRVGDADGPVFDDTFQQFHDDGNENLVSAGLPPALGNVCLGAWKRVGPRAYRLRHTTWNWSPPDAGFGVPGTFAGRFEMIVNIFVNQRGGGFNGTFSAKNYDADGEHLPELDAEGVVRATRFTAD